MKAFLRCIAITMEQEKDEIWGEKIILQPIGISLNKLLTINTGYIFLLYKKIFTFMRISFIRCYFNAIDSAKILLKL